MFPTRCCRLVLTASLVVSAVNSAHISVQREAANNHGDRISPRRLATHATENVLKQKISQLGRWAVDLGLRTAAFSPSDLVYQHRHIQEEEFLTFTSQPSPVVEFNDLASLSENELQTSTTPDAFASPRKTSAERPSPGTSSTLNSVGDGGTLQLTLPSKTSLILQPQASYSQLLQMSNDNGTSAVTDIMLTSLGKASLSGIVETENSPEQNFGDAPRSTRGTSVGIATPPSFQELNVEASVAPSYTTKPVQSMAGAMPEDASSASRVEPSREGLYIEIPDEEGRPSPVSVETMSLLTTDGSELVPILLPSAAADELEKDQGLETTFDPAESMYKALEVGKNITYRVQSGALVYKGPRVSSDPGHESQLILMYERTLNTPSTARFEPDGQSMGQESAETSLKALKIQTVWENREHIQGPVSLRSDISLYAFEGDPQSSNPGLLAASTTYSQARNATKGVYVTLEVPIEVGEQIYFLVSVSTSLGPIDIRVLSTEIIVTAPRQRPWNVAALKAGPAILSTGPMESYLSFVYVLSSAPYTQHLELQDADIDLSALNDLYAIMGSTEIDPFCNSRGTEIAAALVGRHLGTLEKATVVPVPIESCSNPASERSLATAFSWLRRHMVQETHGRFFIIIEDSAYLRKQLKSLSKIIQEVSKSGALIFLPTSSCHQNEPSFISVGPYGLREDGNLDVLNMTGSCVHEFDTFAPGLHVLGASTVGPYTYRNIPIGADIAAAGAASVVINAIQDQDFNVGVADLKKIFQSKLHRTIAFMGSSGDESVTVPALGLQSSHELAAILMSIFKDSPHSNDNKAASTIIPNLPNSALIGICASAGVIIIALILGGVLVSKRNRAEISDDSWTTTNNTHSDGGEGEHNDEGKSGGDTVLEPKIVETDTKHADHEMPDRPGRSPDVVVGQRKHATETPEKRVPVVQRLLSLSRSKDSSPATPNAKASWFATPKGNESGTHHTFVDEPDSVSDGEHSQEVVQIDTAESLPVLDGELSQEIVQIDTAQNLQVLDGSKEGNHLQLTGAK